MIKGQVSIQAQVLLFLFFALTVAVLLKQLQKKYTFISYTPTLFLVSVGFGYFYQYQGMMGKAIMEVSSMDPRGILIIFLPPLIFEGAFNSDWHIFRKQATQIFILAFPCVLISALIIMFSIKAILGYDDSYYNYPQAFMFGSVLSCTDTVAVLALLKQAGAPKKFNSLIEGQSLFNDGTCMVLLTISFELIKGSAPPPLEIGILFIELTVGGIMLGVVFGAISTFLINFVKNDAVLTLNVTLASCYLVYFTAEYVKLGIRVSGIMALVSLGLYMAAFGRTKIPAETRQKIHHFWKIVVYITQTIIFIIGGVIVGIKVLNNHEMKVIGGPEVFRLMGLYCCMTLARFTAIAIFMPKLQNEGYGLKWNQVLVLTYGGLRGAVGIAFTLILAADPTLDKKFTFICLFNMSGCSILTLVINANTAGVVIKKLGLCVKSDTKTRLFVKFLKECLRDLNDRMAQFQKNKYVQNADWDKVREKAGVVELQKNIEKYQERITKTFQPKNSQQMKDIKSLHMNLLEQHVIGESDEALMMELRNRFCIVLKGIFWQKFQKNECSSQSVIVLNECVDFDLDTIDQPLNSWEYLVSHIHNKYFFPICFWCKKYPIIGGIADSMIFDRAGFIYDVVSTYLEALSQTEEKSHQFPFDEGSLNRLIEQSQQNRKLASAYLDKQIKISYPEIMKRIQTAKASQSILTFQKLYIKENRRHGQLDEQFYKILKLIIENNVSRVDNESSKGQTITEVGILLNNEFFQNMNQRDLKTLLDKKIDLTLQKDQPLIREYERTKYLYLVTRGEVYQECRINNMTMFKQSKRIYQLVGVNAILLSNRRQLEHCVTANSTVCFFCFPLQEIKNIIIKNENLEGILYKDVVACCSRIDENYEKFKITPQSFSKMRNSLQFKTCESKQFHQISDKTIIVIEGRVQIDGNKYVRGYFDIKDGNVAKIEGPAKYFVLDKNFSMMDRFTVVREGSIARQNAIENRTDTIIDRALYK